MRASDSLSILRWFGQWKTEEDICASLELFGNVFSHEIDDLKRPHHESTNVYLCTNCVCTAIECSKIELSARFVTDFRETIDKFHIGSD